MLDHHTFASVWRQDDSDGFRVRIHSQRTMYAIGILACAQGAETEGEQTANMAFTLRMAAPCDDQVSKRCPKRKAEREARNPQPVELPLGGLAERGPHFISRASLASDIFILRPHRPDQGIHRRRG